MKAAVGLVPAEPTIESYSSLHDEDVSAGSPSGLSRRNRRYTRSSGTTSSNRCFRPDEPDGELTIKGLVVVANCGFRRHQADAKSSLGGWHRIRIASSGSEKRDIVLIAKNRMSPLQREHAGERRGVSPPSAIRGGSDSPRDH
jgi:hypothetical protein